MSQFTLFDDPPPGPAMPEGWRYENDFLTPEEEAALLALMRSLPLRAARYKGYTARRRVLSYGGSFDYDANRLEPAQPLIAPLHGLRSRVARWIGVDADQLFHVLIAEYPPGAPLGWHRDVPDFQDVAGVSLGGEAVLRLRPYPPVGPTRGNILRVHAASRSIYMLCGPARWNWQHSVAPVAEPRWSITFRTRRNEPQGPFACEASTGSRAWAA